MFTISLCMIVKNEEKTLNRCLTSIMEACDEIIIVDTGSTDKTKEIAQKFTSKIYDFKWIDDFSKARNFSFSKATKDYILWLDADDVVSKENLKKIIELKNSNEESNVDIFMFKYNIQFDQNNNPTFSYYRERLLRRLNNYLWLDPVHECIQISGNIKYLDIAVEHRKELNQAYSNRNLKIYEKLINNGSLLSARQQFYYARELYYNNKIKKAITQFNIFLKDEKAWIENKLSASLDLANCYVIIKNYDKAVDCLLKTFKYAPMRAEIICALAKIMQNLNKFNEAIQWYELALKLEPNLESGGFYNLDNYNYIPYIELCVCYYKIGDIEKAMYYNDLAGKVKPNDNSVNYNKSFFDMVAKNNE